MPTDRTHRPAVLRRMIAPDVADCVRVLQEHDPSQNAHEWAARFGRDVADADRLPVVALVDDVVAGYARTLPFHRDRDSPPEAAPDGYYLLGLVVAPDHRNRGIGRLLIEERMRWLTERAATGVYFDTDIDNVTSRRLHEHMGFRVLTRDFCFPALPSDHTEILYHRSLPAAKGKATDSRAPTGNH